MSDLAIVIPAYKASFLSKTLQSVDMQSDKNFNLYICNDNSPYDIDSIVENFKYNSDINITYIKFKENLGGKDLVQHWTRCIEQIKDEKWIWLFSDDDLMECNCVREINKIINTPIKEDVLHFNINIIDENDNIINKCPLYPEHISSQNFFRKLYTWKIEARMPEFILRKSALQSKGGFVNFDMAWRSDNATIIKVAHPNGIKTIPNCRVNWRYSSENISALKIKSVYFRKQKSTIDFFNWVYMFFNKHSIHYPLGFFTRNLVFARYLMLKQLNNVDEVCKQLNQTKSILDKIFIKLLLKII